jgi:hypothetical protein
MALSPDGERFAIAGANGSIPIYTFTPGPAPTPPKKK